MKKIMILFMVFCMLGGCALADVGVTGDSVNLRKGPGAGFQVIANVPQGTALGDLGYIGSDEDGENWYWVEYQGEKCWISAKFAERAVSAYDAPPASDFPHKELLGRWKMTSHTVYGSNVGEEDSLEIVGAGMILSLVHDGKDGVSLQGNIQLNDGAYVSRFVLPAVCEDWPVTAWRQELADVEARNELWSVKLYNPDEEDYWDFYIDPSDENHLTLYWMLHFDRGYIDVFEFERMGENDTDDGSTPMAWLALSTELLLGEWEAAYGRIDTYSYEDAKAEGMESSLAFYPNEYGEMRLRWRGNNDSELDGIKITTIDARSLHEPLDAPWYIDLTRLMEPGRRAYLYLEDTETLYMVQEYTIDGMPASDCVVYRRRAE